MTSPRISVVLPFYNAEKTLKACLGSIRNQTLKDIEIILVDDGSTDGGLEIARAFERDYIGTCVVLTKENGGPASARNLGLDTARGEFVAFVDSDDTIDSTMYEKLLSSADKHDADIVSCGRLAINAKTGTVIKQTTPGYEVLHGPLDECPDIVKRVGPLMCDKMFRRSIIEEQGIRFDEDIWYAEDFLFGTHVKLHVNTVSAVREDLYHYAQSDESITGGLTHVMDIPEVCRRVVELYRNAGLLERVSDQLLFVLAGYYLRKCKSAPKGELFASFKSEFVELFEHDFADTWKRVVLRRIIKNYRGPGMLKLGIRALF